MRGPLRAVGLARMGTLSSERYDVRQQSHKVKVKADRATMFVKTHDRTGRNRGGIGEAPRYAPAQGAQEALWRRFFHY